MLGPVIFVALMAVIFQSVFMWATPIMNAIDGGVSALGRLLAPALPAMTTVLPARFVPHEVSDCASPLSSPTAAAAPNVAR